MGMMLRDDFRCQYCGTRLPASGLTCDHVVPQSRGGRTTWDNTVACCHACNGKKAALHPKDLKRVGMRMPSPFAPTAPQLQNSARKLCEHNMRRKDNVPEAWRVHLGLTEECDVDDDEEGY